MKMFNKFHSWMVLYQFSTILTYMSHIGKVATQGLLNLGVVYHESNLKNTISCTLDFYVVQTFPFQRVLSPTLNCSVIGQLPLVQDPHWLKQTLYHLWMWFVTEQTGCILSHCYPWGLLAGALIYNTHNLYWRFLVNFIPLCKW